MTGHRSLLPRAKYYVEAPNNFGETGFRLNEISILSNECIILRETSTQYSRFLNFDETLQVSGVTENKQRAHIF